MPRNGGIHDKKQSRSPRDCLGETLSKGDRPYRVTQSYLTGD